MRSPLRTAAMGTVWALAFSLPSLAHAGDAPNAAAAQTLFDDAKTLMQARDFARACPKLEESEKLQAAGGTLMFLALCREGEGKTATAWTLFNEVLSGARRDGRHDREKVAQDHITALAPRLTRISIVVSDSAQHQPGLEIRRDDVAVPSELWGTAIPVDPGAHVLRATATGMIPWETTASTTAEGQTTTVNVAALVAAPASPEPQVGTRPQSDPRRTRRIAGLAVGGAGVALLGVGAAFGALALAKKGDESNACSKQGVCGSLDVASSHTAVHDGNVSTILLSVGAAALVGGGALWLTARTTGPSDDPAATKPNHARWRAVPILGGHFAGLGLGTTW
jgi:hypothetical protein